MRPSGECFGVRLSGWNADEFSCVSRWHAWPGCADQSSAAPPVMRRINLLFHWFSFVINIFPRRSAAVPDFASYSLDDFSWARMMVASRNFGIVVDGMRTDALVPYADMLNHYR